MAESVAPDDAGKFLAPAADADPSASRRVIGGLGPGSKAASPKNTTDEDIVKFLSIAVETPDGGAKPFDVVPIHIPSTLPWWAWASLGVVLAGLFLAVVFLPIFRLNERTARLSADSFADAQAAMRELIVSGDGHTIDRLFEIASSTDEGIVARLRAVDALSMIHEPAADQALLHLEIADRTDETVRQAAINARRQRQASRSGPHAD